APRISGGRALRCRDGRDGARAAGAQPPRLSCDRELESAMSGNPRRVPFALGPMPAGRAMTTVDRGFVRAPAALMFRIARAVDEWPAHLPHYRFVRFRERAGDGGGIVEMSANRPFGPLNWPTRWLSEMQVTDAAGSEPAIRFRHIG